MAATAVKFKISRSPALKLKMTGGVGAPGAPGPMGLQGPQGEPDNASAVLAEAAATSAAAAEASAASAAASAAAAGNSMYVTRATAEAATIPGGTQFLKTGGYAASGDGGEWTYDKVGADPGEALINFQSADGAWWEAITQHEIRAKIAGVKADGVTDDTAALQAVIDLLPAAGGTIILPRGTVLCASTLDMEDRRSIVLQGQGGLSRGAAPATILMYSGTGTRFLNCRGTAGVFVRDCSVQYNNAGFSGSLVDFSLSAASGETAFSGIDRALLTPSGVAGTATLLQLNKATLCTFNEISFVSGAPAISGQANGGASYSNVHTFNQCTFLAHVGPAINFGGEDWTFNQGTWQADSAGKINCFSTNGSTPVRGMTFNGCSTYDTTVAGGTGFTFHGTGITFSGGLIQGEAGSQAISLNGVDGFTAVGVDFNTFVTAIAFDTATVNDVLVHGCSFRSCTNKYGSTSNLGTIYNIQSHGIGLATASTVSVAGSRILSARETGWSVATGTATRTAFATTTVTTEQLAERVKALIDDLHATAGHGLIGT